MFFCRIWLACSLLIVCGLFPPGSNAATLRLAATTSVQDTGLLGLLLPRFSKSSGYEVKTEISGSGHALRLGRTGAVDVVFVNAPDAELRFIKEGFGRNRTLVMSNEFILVGPANDPANLAGSRDALDAMQRIYAKRHLFVSRGDDSGTHKREKALWSQLSISPVLETWYFELGDGMGATLSHADQARAYTLTDRATWLSRKKHLSLVKVLEGDPLLTNHYSVVAVNPDTVPNVNYRGAKAFIEWLVSPQMQQFIGDYKANSLNLFRPAQLTNDKRP